jgi:hypothetical protein
VFGRRLLVLLIVLAAIAVPALVLHALCVGNACGRTGGPEARVPFCSLPEGLRGDLEHGFREGRSPDVLAVTAGTTLWSPAGGTDLQAPWPGARATSTEVPLVFWGAGVPNELGEIPTGTTLDRVAPTLARIVGLDRPFPEVRSGEPLEGFTAGARPRLVLLVAWKGVGAADLQARPEDSPFLSQLFATGAGTVAAATGSLPLDPAATLTTIGTGGLPYQHGITGSWIRGDDGDLVRPFGPGAPVTVIATLADDLEEADPATLVGLVATAEEDRGLIGGGWYPDTDPTDVVLGDAAAAPLAVGVHLSTGYGADRTPDILGVVLEGSVRAMDRWTRAIVRDASHATDGSVVVVVAGTGSAATDRLAIPASRVVAEVEGAVPGARPVVAHEVAGGLFLDQDVLTEQEITGQVVVDALLEAETPDGETMFADAFQGFAVSFARYC